MGRGNNRNQLCLCGSGRKYKKCCLEIDFLSKEMEKNNLRDVDNKEKRILKSIDNKKSADLISPKNKKCFVSNCDNEPIKSHTTPKHFLEEKFSCKVDDVDIVYWSNLNKMTANILDTDSHRKFLYQTPITQAGVLPLFCREHERIFSPIECNEPEVSIEQYIFLTAYRSFAYVYFKENYLRNDLIKDDFIDENINRALSDSIVNSYKIIHKNSTKIISQKYNNSKWRLIKQKFEKLFLQHNFNLPANSDISKEFFIQYYEIKEDFLWTAHGVTERSYNNDIEKRLPACYGVIPKYKNFPSLFYILSPIEEAEYLKDNLIINFDKSYEVYKQNKSRDFLYDVQYCMIDCSENFILSPQLYARLEESNQIRIFDSINSLSVMKKQNNSEELQNVIGKLYKELDLFNI